MSTDRGLRRRLRAGVRAHDVVLFTDWTLLRLSPPLRAAWAPIGITAVVPITRANAKRVVFGAINAHTGHRIVLIRPRARGTDMRAFLTVDGLAAAAPLWVLLLTPAEVCRKAGLLSPHFCLKNL